MNGIGGGTGGGNNGMEMDTGTISTANGNLSITGDGTAASDTGSYDTGVAIAGGTVKTTGTGANLTLTGYGSTTASGSNN